MNLRALKEQIGGIRLHDLAETNCDDVRIDGGCVLIESGAGLRADLEDANAELKSVNAELKEVEKERDEMQRRVLELEALMETGPEDGPARLRDALTAAETFQQRASDWAKECAALRVEVSAMRKRKGIAAGVCAYSHEVWTLLGYVSQTEGRYREDARKMCGKIYTL